MAFRIYSEMFVNSFKSPFPTAVQFKCSLQADLAYNCFQFRAVYYASAFKVIGNRVLFWVVHFLCVWQK